LPDFIEQQSLESKIIKILRITNEPLSAHALSDIYNLSYSKVKEILKGLAEDGVVYALKVSRGTFYFIPDKYFKRDKDMLESEKKLPFIWYEDLSSKELETRKEKILSIVSKIKKDYQKKELTASEYFQMFQDKNEELMIINQIIEERISRKMKKCYYCQEIIDVESSICPYCKKEVPICSVCKRKIYNGSEVLACPNCNAKAHSNHIREWLKSIGSCPNCKKHLLEQDLIVP
jgi:predicted transcriptional regulator